MPRRTVLASQVVAHGATLDISGKLFTVERITVDKVFGFYQLRANTKTHVSFSRAHLLAKGYEVKD